MKLSRKALGINGVHTKLGNEITDAEFRGYVIAKMEEAVIQRQEFKDMVEKHATEDADRFAAHEKDIESLKSSREKAAGFIAGIGALAGVVGSVIIAIILKILRL